MYSTLPMPHGELYSKLQNINVHLMNIAVNKSFLGSFDLLRMKFIGCILVMNLTVFQLREIFWFILWCWLFTHSTWTPNHSLNFVSWKSPHKVRSVEHYSVSTQINNLTANAMKVCEVFRQATQEGIFSSHGIVATVLYLFFFN